MHAMSANFDFVNPLIRNYTNHFSILRHKKPEHIQNSVNEENTCEQALNQLLNYMQPRAQ